MNQLPITLGFDPTQPVGGIVIAQSAKHVWDAYIRGEMVLTPSFVKRPGGSLEIIELSLIPAGTEMPAAMRTELIANMPIASEQYP